LAHLAFIPAYAAAENVAGHGRPDAGVFAGPKQGPDSRGARLCRRGVSTTHKRRGCMAVEAEIEAKLGDGGRAAELIGRSEYTSRFWPPDNPEWMDFFTPPA